MLFSVTIKPRIRLITLLLVAISTAGLSLSAGAACTREELARSADDFLKSLSNHAPALAPLAKNVRITENSKDIKAGAGLWQTAGQVSFQRKVLDRETCGAVVQAVLAEEGQEKETILGARLRLDQDKNIAEIESYIARATEFAQKPEGVPLQDGDDWETILPAQERSGREQMNTIADQYFEMFDRPQEVQPPFATPCNRYENGTRTTRDDCSNMGPAGRGGLKMTERRYPIADLEAGITVGFVLFAGRLLDFHMFKIRNGEVTQIQAVVGPAVESSGWN